MSKLNRKPRVCVFDIETSLMEVTSFSLYPKYLSHTAIRKDWHLISAAWKFLGEKKVYGCKTYTNDDKKVVEKLCKAIEKADVIVGHNGDKFDMRKLNARIIYHRLPPIAKPISVDTLKQARKHFGFTSNRLDYIAKYLNVGGKMETAPYLWERALNGEKKAIDEMLRYNKQDVVILEEVYKVMEPYIDTAYNRNLDFEYDVCPSCGGAHLIKYGYHRSKMGSYQKYRCMDCLKVSVGSKRIHTAKVK